MPQELRVARAGAEITPPGHAKPLVIGANGYIGRHVCAYYQSQSVPFAMTTRGEANALSMLFPGNHVTPRVNLAEKSSFEALMRPRTIILLASNSVPSTFAHSVKDEIHHNLLSYVNFFESIEPGSRVIYLSSGGTVYGNGGVGHISESQEAEPVSPYGLTKLMIEDTLRYYANTRGFDYIILRPSNPAGPEMFLPMEERRIRPQGIINIFIGRMLAGEPIQIFGDGLMCRDYFDVRDLARAVFLADQTKEATRQILNVGAGSGVTVLDVLQKITDVIGLAPLIESRPARSFDVRSNVLSNTEIGKVLGWHPKITLETSITDTVRSQAAT